MICPKLNRLFVHVTKCGGSSMEKALRILEGTDDLPESELRKRHFIYGEGDTQHFPLSQIRRYHPAVKDWPALGLVRDPYERAVSEFFYQRKKGNLVGEKDLNYSIESGDLWRGAWRWHQATASNVLRGNCEIFKLEELAAKAPEIASFLGVESIKIPHNNRTATRPEARALLSREAKRKIVERFWEDFFNYGYPI